MYADLSRIHEVVSDLFPKVRPGADLDQYRLTAEQVDFYRENGYLKGLRVLNERQIQALRDELSKIIDPAHPGHDLFYEFHSNESLNPDTVLFHALGAWRLTAAMHDILWHPAITVPVSQLLEGSVRFWHDQLFCKPPKHGGVVAWHQDYSYWTRTKPMAHLTCWIGLDPATRDNGCLWYVPKSHRWPLLPVTGLAGGMDAIREVLSADQLAEFDKRVPIELAAGECAFHHPLMVHGSFENRTEMPRRAVVLNYMKDGVCSDSDATLLEGVPPVPKGNKMQGQFFPLLLDTSQK